MNIKVMVEEIERRATLFSNYPVYDALTYSLCKSFQTMYITHLIGKRTYNKYIDKILNVQQMLFEYYKYSTNITTDDRETFFDNI